MSEPAPHLERRRYTDRRADSPKLREWVNGLSALGKLLVLSAGVLGGGASVVGAKSVLDGPAPDVSHLAGRIDALERSVGASLRIQCLHTSDLEVGYARLPCDSLMRDFPGWRSMRAETLRTQAAVGLHP